MTAEAKAIEERWTQRLSDAINGTEERIFAKITRLNPKVVELSNQLKKSSDVASTQKRPAELACEKITSDLRSIGETNFTDTDIPYQLLFLYISEKKRASCQGALIDKRFFITTAECLHSEQFTRLKLANNEKGWTFDKEIKATHIHPKYSPETRLNNIGLVELKSDVDYIPELYPVCLYASQMKPKSDLIQFENKVQIIADNECAELKPSQICAKNLVFHCTFTGFPVFELKETFPKYHMFGIVAMNTCNFKPFVINKVFDHLDFIEGIVWPKSGN